MKTTLFFLQLFSITTSAFACHLTDTIPPKIDTIYLTGTHELDVLFTEETDSVTSAEATNYTMTEDQSHPTYVIQDRQNRRLAHLVFSYGFQERKNYDLQISGIKDMASLMITDTTVRFVKYIPMPYDIIIDEIMADPTPSNGLPDAEWIEIRNASPFAINLSGWKLAKTTGRTGPIAAIVLKPDSMAVLCSSGSAGALSGFCHPVSVTYFPSLSNAEDRISLLEPGGRTIHAVHYTDDWYHNQLKQQGGWSLEMTDINNPCSGIDNWSSSVNVFGATPGRINSTDAINLDIVSPKLSRAYTNDSLHVILIFNEPMDSVEAMNRFHYRIDKGIGIPDSVLPLAPYFDKISLRLPMPLTNGCLYSITVDGLRDCLSNPVSNSRQVSFGIAALPDSLDVVVNEILYNPADGVSDYVELYNRSGKIINIKNLHIANLNSAGITDNICDLPDDGFLLLPGTCMAFTTDSYSVKRAYVSENPDAIIQTDNLPSFNDDEGNVILLNQQGKVIDRLHYEDSWQFALLDETEGVSLERINRDGATQDRSNWHSASGACGFGTPGYRNSQMIDTDTIQGEVTIHPPVISPDNDGRDDVGLIQYTFRDPGNVVTVIIYDITGRPVRHLVTQMLCGTRGSFSWDGMDDFGRKILSGNHVIVTELFNVRGKMKKFRQVMAVRN